MTLGHIHLIVKDVEAQTRFLVDMMGGTVANTAAVGVLLGYTNNTGILNLNGGVLEASVIAGYNGPVYANATAGYLNFNGGTLQASAGSSSFITVSSANIYSGGATIDNNGNGITLDLDAISAGNAAGTRQLGAKLGSTTFDQAGLLVDAP